MKLCLVFFTILIFHLSAWASPMDGAKLKEPLPRNIWVELNKKISPSVIGIFVELKKTGRLNKTHYRDPLFDFLEDYSGYGLDSHPPEDLQDSRLIGSGFIISNDGLVITNHHIIERAFQSTGSYKLKVKVRNQKKLFDAEVISYDSRGDLALLKIAGAKDLPALEFNANRPLEVGEHIATFGNPLSHSSSISTGVISSITLPSKELNRFPLIQIDTEINPSNSGGPLVNTLGYVIGVNTFLNGQSQGMGFAIPISYLEKVLPALKKGGSIPHGFLGIGLKNLNKATTRSMKLDRLGILVTKVAKNSPAEDAGLKVYDIIVGFNNRSIERASQLTPLLQGTPFSEKIKLQVMRSTGHSPYRSTDITVIIGNYPSPGTNNKKEAFHGHSAPYNLGFTIIDSSSGARRSFNIPTNSTFGPIVSDISPGRPSSKAGLEVGDIILEINKKPTNLAKDVLSLLKKGSNTLQIKRRDDNLAIVIQSD